ncbi:MAG: hypothetical protein ACK4H7_05015, partial [Acidilobaceae archaeon]
RFKCSRNSPQLVTCIDDYYNFLYLLSPEGRSGRYETVVNIVARSPTALNIVKKQVNHARRYALELSTRGRQGEKKEGETGQ